MNKIKDFFKNSKVKCFLLGAFTPVIVILFFIIFFIFCNNLEEIEQQFNDPVVYNRVSRIYHEPDCEWAEKCVENCIMMERSEAEQIGRHCYVCK